jgi:hypothetical protein
MKKTISSNPFAAILIMGVVLALPASVGASWQAGLSSASIGAACVDGVLAKEETTKPKEKGGEEEDCE